MKTLHLEDFSHLSNRGIHIHAFAGLPTLHNLTLASCNLTSVPVRALSVLINLRKLDLSQNPLTVKPKLYDIIYAHFVD